MYLRQVKRHEIRYAPPDSDSPHALTGHIKNLLVTSISASRPNPPNSPHLQADRKAEGIGDAIV